MKKHYPYNIADKLIIGTAQFGIDAYGVKGIPLDDISSEISKILKTAKNIGVKKLDTARAYGRSEEMIGQVLRDIGQDTFKISTKLSPNEFYSSDNKKSVARKISNSLCISEKLLGCIPDALLLHRAEHLLLNNGIVYEVLMQLKNEGYVKNIGVSVQNPKELAMVLRLQGISQVQLPYNIFDWRWDYLIPEVFFHKQRRPLEIRCRSVFLQGLVFSENPFDWARAHVSNHKDIIFKLHELRDFFELKSIYDLCLNFVLSQEWIDGVVVGCNDSAQVVQLSEVNFFKPFVDEQLITVRRKFNNMQEKTLDPSKWEKYVRGDYARI